MDRRTLEAIHTEALVLPWEIFVLESLLEKYALAVVGCDDTEAFAFLCEPADNVRDDLSLCFVLKWNVSYEVRGDAQVANG